jgi:Cft2 family RNA processing exonuclease
MKFIDLNPKREIGAHSLHIEVGAFRILIDGGMSPKDVGLACLPDYTRIPKDSVDLILLTHCHLDHIGSLPCVHRLQPSARLLMTRASAEILPVMLQNSHTVMLRQRDELDVKEYPLFTRQEVDAVSDDTFIMSFGHMREFIKDGDRLKITFYPAGHVMGAASILLEHQGVRYFFTGDILFRDQNTLHGAQIPQMQVDVLVTETTRGLAELPAGFSYEDEILRLLESVAQTLNGGGSCLLPVFALGRLQEMVTLIYTARRHKILPRKFPIYCSGLGLAIVDVFEKIYRNRHYDGIDYRAENPIEVPEPKLGSPHPMAPRDKCLFRKHFLRDLGVRPLIGRRLKTGLDIRVPSLFIMSSGMLAEHTPSYQIASSLLPYEHNLIAFTGYCDADTPGGKLLTMQPGETFSFDVLKFETPIRATIRRYDFTGHADREDLVHLAQCLRPKTIVLSHGEQDSRLWFTKEFATRMPAAKIINPEPQMTYDI